MHDDDVDVDQHSALVNHPIGRWFLGAAMLIVALSIVAPNMPASSVRDRVDVLWQPAREFGLVQDWGVFSPNPRSQSIDVRARILYDDGSIEFWDLPDFDPVIGAYRSYRWHKWQERVRLDNRQDLWDPTAQWLAGEYTRDGVQPASITLIPPLDRPSAHCIQRSNRRRGLERVRVLHVGAPVNADAVADLLHRLFVAPRAAWPLAIARVLIGIGILGWSVSMWFDVSVLLANDGVIGPEFTSSLWRWIPIESVAAARVALVALAACALAIIAGWRPTIWLLVAFVLLMSIQRASPLILNSGDIILRDLTLLLALTPTGAAMSLDRVRTHGRDAFFTSAMVAPWGLRLVQLQMMVVYIFAFWSKSGELWTNGTAVSIVLRLQDLQRFAVPDFIVTNALVIAVLTWSTLIVEIALGLLLWAKPLRPYLIVMGVLLHLSIDASLLVGFFGIAMIAGLMTFLDADWIDERMRQRVGQRMAQPTGGAKSSDKVSAT